jgi:hypothetical protein
MISLLHVYQFDNKMRFGCNQDGGYVLGKLEGEYDCYISAGINNEESFSRDFINYYNMNEYNSFGFDGTIQHYPYEYTNKISFIKKNIAGENNDNNTNLSYLINKNKNIFLKMDIEGGEYHWLWTITNEQLTHFKQIVIEFHGVNDDSWGTINPAKVICLEKLNKTHYLIHAHGNNHGPITNNIPDTLELTYINKNYFESEPLLNTISLPINGLDFPNNGIDGADYNLNIYPFVSNI